MVSNYSMAKNRKEADARRKAGERVANCRHSQSSVEDGKGMAQHWRNNRWRDRLALSRRERQAILGTLLGDTSILVPNKRSKSPRLASNHSTVQYEWALHKARVLRRLRPVVEIVENKGYGAELVRFRSSCLPALCGIYDLVGAGHKRVNPKWLDAIGRIGLAWWYCDDGNFQRKSGIVTFHTEGFSVYENRIMRSWFARRYGDAKIYRHKRGYRVVVLPRVCAERMFRDIAAFVPKCMRYKLGQ